MNNPLNGVPFIADAVQRYADYMRTRKGSGAQRQRVMPPWDENAFFALPIETQFLVPNVAPALSVAIGNPMRVALIMSCNATTQIFVSTDSNMTGQKGFTLNASANPWAISQKDYGPLVAQPWFAIAATNGNLLTVWEILLNRWPAER